MLRANQQLVCMCADRDMDQSGVERGTCHNAHYTMYRQTILIDIYRYLEFAFLRATLSS